MRLPTAVFASISAAVLLAPVGGAAQEYYADVRPVLVESCMGCHNDAGIGWSMENAEETYQRHRQIAGAVTSGKMPPWIAEPGHQAYMDDLSLSDDVVGVVAAWRAAGYPKGDVRPDPVRTASREAFRADLSLDVLGGASYLPVQSMSDDYRCFVVDWTVDEPMYVTGFRTRPGNANVAHHTVVHVIEPEMAQRYREVDAEVGGAGYECFGSALPTSFDWDAYEARYPDGRSELDGAEWWLAHWAPGMFGHHFPEGTGILVRPGSALVVQMHYYTGDAPGERDAGTEVDFEMEPIVERPAFHLVQTKNDWLDAENNGSMVIPAGEMATYVVDMQLGSWVENAAWMAGVDESRIEGFEVHSANLHMHAFGHSGEITLTAPDGRTEVLLSVPDWNLHWQRDFAFEEPKVFTREELGNTSLRVRCTYQNPTSEAVYGGFGSYDEMCFNFSYVSLELADKATTEGAAPGR